LFVVDFAFVGSPLLKMNRKHAANISYITLHIQLHKVNFISIALNHSYTLKGL